MKDNKTILVTGGLGFIGSHTVVSLVNSGFTPIIIDDLSNSKIEVHSRLEEICKRKIQFFNFNLSNKKSLNLVFDEFNIHSVIHFAAFKAVGESVEDPIKYYANNVSNLISLLEVMLKSNCNKIIFSSSCTVYGQPEQIPVTEDSEMLPAFSPYGETKQICEKILMDCSKSHNLKTISLRYFNPIGAHSSFRIGELPLGIPQNLVPFICETAHGIRDELMVWGNDYNTADGTAVRDYIDVNDLADAHVIAAENQENLEKSYEVFNIGSGKGHSVLEIISAFEDANNVSVKYKFASRRDGDVEKIFCNPNKIKNKLGWKPKRTLQESLRTAWEWQKRGL